jgi:hypothetical protein
MWLTSNGNADDGLLVLPSNENENGETIEIEFLSTSQSNQQIRITRPDLGLLYIQQPNSDFKHITSGGIPSFGLMGGHGSADYFPATTEFIIYGR